MLNKEIENKILQWEMEGIGEINALLDTFNYEIKTKRYFLNGYLAIDKQLQETGQIKEDSFFINHVKKDLKRKGINPAVFQDAKDFRYATQGIFLQYSCEVYDAIIELLDARHSLRFFILNESEIDVLDEKLTALVTLESSYIVHADILLDSENYSALLFLNEYVCDGKTFRGQIEKLVYDSLQLGNVLTIPQEKISDCTLIDYLDINRRKLEIDAKINLEKIKVYAERYQSVYEELGALLISTSTIDFFDIDVVLTTLNSKTLPDIDKIKILSLMVKDIEKNLYQNLEKIKSIRHLSRLYNGLTTLIIQTKIVMMINKLSHDFYCGELSQLVKLELLKASIIHHFINK